MNPSVSKIHIIGVGGDGLAGLTVRGGNYSNLPKSSSGRRRFYAFSRKSTANEYGSVRTCKRSSINFAPGLA